MVGYISSLHDKDLPDFTDENQKCDVEPRAKEREVAQLSAIASFKSIFNEFYI